MRWIRPILRRPKERQLKSSSEREGTLLLAARALLTLVAALVITFGTSARLSDHGVIVSVGVSQADATPTQQCQPPLDGMLVYETGVGWWECRCTLNCRWVFITGDPIVVVNGNAVRMGVAYCEDSGQITSIDYDVWVNTEADVSIVDLPSPFPEHVTIHRSNAPSNAIRLVVTMHGNGEFDAIMRVNGAIESGRRLFSVSANTPKTSVLRLTN